LPKLEIAEAEFSWDKHFLFSSSPENDDRYAARNNRANLLAEIGWQCALASHAKVAEAAAVGRPGIK